MRVHITPYNAATDKPPAIDMVAASPCGGWQVLGYAGKCRNGNPYWKCQCECGMVRDVAQTTLRTKSPGGCGCGRTIAARKKRPDGHIVWTGMLQRCHNAKSVDYHNYGGRGIVVCGAWRRSFAAFMADMGPRPSPKHQIDRFPDNNGNYCPENCRWATKQEQMNNRRNNVWLEHNGMRKTLSQWAVHLGVKVQRLWKRHRAGWSAERILEALPK